MVIRTWSERGGQLGAVLKRHVGSTFVALGRGRNQDVNRAFLLSKEDVDKVSAINPLLDPIASKSLRGAKPSRMPKTSRFLRVSLIGLPNAGKSTLVNQIVGSNVCPHSLKVHTTRRTSLGVLTRDDAQVVFFDTPGCITLEEKEKFNLEDSLFVDPQKSCQESDIVIVVHDVSNRFVREAISKRVLKMLCHNANLPAVLVLNKMDTIPRSKMVLNLIRKLTCGQLEGRKSHGGNVPLGPEKRLTTDAYFAKRLKRHQREEASDLTRKNISIHSYEDLLNVLKGDIPSHSVEELIEDLCRGLVGWPGFRDVFTVSALDGSGVDDLRDYLFYKATPGRWRYNEKVVTTDDPKQLVVDVVKSKFLDVLDHDVPYKIQPRIESWVVENGVLRLLISVQSTAPRTTNLLLYHRASNLSMVAKLTERDLQNLFHCEVLVLITVDVTHKPKKTLFHQPPLDDRISLV